MYRIILRFLFLLSAEKAHHLALDSLKLLCKIPFFKSILTSLYVVRKEYEFLGIRFKNRVGLAAGFDKNAKYLGELSALGFGFVEIGTVTPKPQAGNDKPRLFRLIEDESVINRMGFNNDGLDVIVERLQSRPKDLIVGGNIGKNKVTPNEEAVNDYTICFYKLYDVVDYFVVNVSSPNTPNLRELQDKKPLGEILKALMEMRSAFISKGKICKPILLKIAPDLSNEQLDDVVDIVKDIGIDGIVATNTTISRAGLLTSKEKVESIGAGGLSGKILSDRATEVVAYIYKKSSGKIPIIGVGGIHSPETALDKLNAGAGLVQVYSGFIYGGPQMIKDIAKAI